MADPDNRTPDQKARDEAERTLRRVHQDSAPVLGSAFQRSADFFAARDAGDDPAELWGKRVGRGLSILVGLGCLAFLYFTYLA